MTAVVDGELLTLKSVTDGDISPSVYYINLALPLGWGGLSGPTLLPDLLPEKITKFYSYQADCVLSSAHAYEGRWASALNIALTKLAGKVWDFKSDTPTVQNRMHQLLTTWEYRRSWQYAVMKLGRNILTTDNGGFIEVERSSGAPGSRITGLFVLDSLRCTRTGVPDQPVIYRDLKGREHVLADYEVLDIVDMPDPAASFYGTGMCAARRAYNSIKILNAIDQYLYEKVTGARPLALDFITGITDKQLEEVLASQKAQRQNQGISLYGGTVVIPQMKNDTVGHVRIPLAELPDKFDRDQIIKDARLDYANALGIDPQELQPISHQSLGAGAQSQVLDAKQEGKGLSFVWQELQYVINNYVLPDSVTFYPVEDDNRHRKAKADIETALVTNATTLFEKGLTDRDESRQILVDQNVLPQQFIAVDRTPTQTIATDEKPEAEAALAQAQQQAALPQAPQQGTIPNA